MTLTGKNNHTRKKGQKKSFFYNPQKWQEELLV